MNEGDSAPEPNLRTEGSSRAVACALGGVRDNLPQAVPTNRGPLCQAPTVATVNAH